MKGVICNLLLVGTELLVGQIDDTNSSWIGRVLLDSGIKSYEHRRVGDNEQRITKAINELLENADCLIVTGGLGPTHDDITREVTAKIMGVDLIHDQDIENDMRAKFAKRNIEMPKNNLRQAMVPQGAIKIPNHTGTAPGLMCPINNKWIYLVPGVPHEMKPMITDHVVPHIKTNGELDSIVIRTIKTWGTSESQLAELLDEYVQQGENSEVKVGFLARGINGIYVKLSVSTKTKDEALALIKPVEAEILEVLGDLVYGFDDQSMEQIILDMFRQNNLTLAIAESFTGGMVSSRLVEVEGMSKVLAGSCVTYATSAKEKILNVKVDDVYSLDCAKQMAQGARNLYETDFAISTTGVSGPDPEQGHQPGEIYIGISGPHGDFAFPFQLGGDRNRVRQYGTITALNTLRLHLSEYSS